MSNENYDDSDPAEYTYEKVKSAFDCLGIVIIAFVAMSSVVATAVAIII